VQRSPLTPNRPTELEVRWPRPADLLPVPSHRTSLTTELGGQWGFRPDGAVAWCLIPLLGSPDSVVS
jgi:hypothetical protein